MRGPQLSPGSLQVTELDRLAAERNNPSAPLAAFDAAYLLGLAPPQNDPKFWDALAKRFDSAARALKDPAQKRLAHDSSTAPRTPQRRSPALIRARHRANRAQNPGACDAFEAAQELIDDQIQLLLDVRLQLDVPRSRAR